MVPQVLNKPVIELGAWMEEVGMHVCREQAPFYHILASLFECKLQTLCQQLCQWVLRYHPEVHMVEKWLAICGLDLAKYLSHLESDKESNGLELWLLSLASDRPFNVVMEDRVFSTGMEGVDFDFPTIILLPSCEAILCELDTPDEAPMAAAPPPPSVTLLSWGGRPLMSVPEYPDLLNFSDEQTDPDTLLETEDRGIQVVMPTSSRAIPRECPVCDNDLPSGMALYRHLRSKHPDERPYTCHDCMHTFNNLRELSSHCSNHH